MKENKKTNLSSLSRRKFVKMASTGVAAFSIVPSFTVSGLGHVAPSDKLYIAAIGCGGEGENDIHHYANAPKKNAVV
ncbi:MAG: twin-arginine translocation signal domain-containing protein, partial [Bacteroidetes bacterium]|nr:twin-arginine translocation signal domain-containing protein [Bacteroidota bacterium]